MSRPAELTAAVPARRLHLPQVTLCAVSSSNVAVTVAALEASLAQVDFAEALLFTHGDPADLELGPGSPIRVVTIAPITSSQGYSRFVLEQLVDHVATSHCLIVQWDGHVIDAARWQPEFLDFDYLGASWPQFDDGHDVGNGGFCLRSRRLMDLCRQPPFAGHHPEDVAICRTNRALLDAAGMRFAPAHLADAFAAERAGDPTQSFGYHGVFLMPRVLGDEGFWNAYASLDELSSLRPDFNDLLRSVLRGDKGARRAVTMIGRKLADARLWRRFRRAN